MLSKFGADRIKTSKVTSRKTKVAPFLRHPFNRQIIDSTAQTNNKRTNINVSLR